MVMPIEIESPRTDFGNATFASTQLPDFSIEPSFISPPRELQNRVDSLGESRHGRPKSNNIATPGARRPLVDRRNAPTGPQRAEFTPLLKSVVKSNFTKANVAARTDGAPPTPAVLKPGYLSNLNSPSLPFESTGINGDTEHSYVPEDSTMQPPGPGSAASTPLAMLPSSNHGGVVLDGQNVMSLREQENVCFIYQYLSPWFMVLTQVTDCQ